MRNVVVCFALGAAIMAQPGAASAKSHRHEHIVVTATSYEVHSNRVFGRGSGPPPKSAYTPIVFYDTFNRSCVSELVQRPDGWWNRQVNCTHRD